MTTEFWRDLNRQADLEAQYDVLVATGHNAHDTAIHLARFAEAQLFTKAERRIDELERQVRAMRSG